jgi:predicted transcriptional regulator with HTH domain
MPIFAETMKEEPMRMTVNEFSRACKSDPSSVLKLVRSGTIRGEHDTAAGKWMVDVLHPSTISYMRIRLAKIKEKHAPDVPEELANIIKSVDRKKRGEEELNSL